MTEITVTASHTVDLCPYWWIDIFIDAAGGELFQASIYRCGSASHISYQGAIDGVPGYSSGDAILASRGFRHVAETIKYLAESDQLVFRCIDGRSVAVARPLVAPALATALGLRQPPDAGFKPAKS